MAIKTKLEKGEELPVYDAKVGNSMNNCGIYAISFVDCPATDQNFVALKKAEKFPVKLSIDRQKQILTGAVLIPDQLIYRYDNQRGEHYMKFSADEIEKIAIKMMKNGAVLTKTTHQHEKNLKNNHLVEVWIVRDSEKDKANALKLGNLPKGTLMASYKIGDKKYWAEQVLTGNVKGFSLEGLFSFKNVTMSKKVEKEEAKKPQAKKGGFSTFLHSLATLLEGETAAEVDDLAGVAQRDETGSGTPFIAFELADGSGEVLADNEGFCTLDGEQMAAGQHALADGNILTVDDNGYFVETTGEAEDTPPAEAELKKARERLAKSYQDYKVIYDNLTRLDAAMKNMLDENLAAELKLKEQKADFTKTKGEYNDSIKNKDYLTAERRMDSLVFIQTGIVDNYSSILNIKLKVKNDYHALIVNYYISP